jgi:hypothetical protein
MSEKALPKGISEALESGEERAALELLGLVEEVAWHLGALPEGEYTFPQPYSAYYADVAALRGKRPDGASPNDPLPLAQLIEEIENRSLGLLPRPEQPSDYAETLTTLGIVAETLAASEEARKVISKLNGSLRAILDAEGYR